MGGVTRTLSYVNDADGNRLRIDHPDGLFFSYPFDGLAAGLSAPAPKRPHKDRG